MPVTVTLRPAGAGDLPVVHGLYRQLYDDRPLVLDERVERAWADTLATPGRTVLLAEVGGAVVGTVDVTVVANAARDARPYLLAENVVVDAAHRDRGVGRALLEAAQQRARTAGCYKVQLSAAEPDAFAFYEAIGMQASGRTYKRYLPG